MFNLSKLGFLDKITGDRLTADEVNEIKAKFNLLVDFINANGVPTPTTGRLNTIYFGDSLTDRNVSGRQPSWSEIMYSTITNTPNVEYTLGSSYAVAGHRYVDQIPYINQYTKDGSYTKTVAFLWCGINDIGTGDTASIVQASITNAVSILKAKGVDVIASTLTAYDASFYGQTTVASVNVERLAFNTWLRANYTTIGISVLVDLASDYRIGSVGAGNDPQYFTDKLHMTLSGRTVVSELEKQGLLLYNMGVGTGIINGQSNPTPPSDPEPEPGNQSNVNFTTGTQPYSFIYPKAASSTPVDYRGASLAAKINTDFTFIPNGYTSSLSGWQFPNTLATLDNFDMSDMSQGALCFEIKLNEYNSTQMLFEQSSNSNDLPLAFAIYIDSGRIFAKYQSINGAVLISAIAPNNGEIAKIIVLFKDDYMLIYVNGNSESKAYTNTGFLNRTDTFIGIRGNNTLSCSGILRGLMLFKTAVTKEICENWFNFADTLSSAVSPPSTNTAESIDLVSVDFSQNVYDVPDNGYNRRGAFAVMCIDTDATNIEITAISPMANQGYGGADTHISIYDANMSFITSVIVLSGSFQTLPATLTSTGVSRYYLVEGGNTQNGPTAFSGTYITKIKRLNGTILGKVTPVKRANRIVQAGDSISIGNGATNTSRYGWAIKTRELLGNSWDIALTGWGAAWAGGRFSTPALQQAEADRVVAYMQGASGRRIYIDVLGTNDFGAFPTSPVAAASYKAAVWDKIHAADPTIKIYSGTPLWRGNKDSNVAGLGNMAVYANAFNVEAFARPSFVVPVDCLPWTSAPDYNGDALHPNDSGMEKIGTKWYQVINNLISYTPEQPTGTPIGQSSEINALDNKIVYSTGWQENGSVQAKFTNLENSSYNVNFTGTHVSMIFEKNNAGGVNQIYIDNVLVEEVSQMGTGEYLFTSPVKPQGAYNLTVKRKAGQGIEHYVSVYGVKVFGDPKSFSIGNLSTVPPIDPPATGVPPTGVPPTGNVYIFGDDAKITYTGTWISNASLKSKYTNEAGVNWSVKFTGTSVTIEYDLGDGCDINEVLVDGVLVGEYNQNAGSTGILNNTGTYFIFTTPILANGIHTLLVRKKTSAPTYVSSVGLKVVDPNGTFSSL